MYSHSDYDPFLGFVEVTGSRGPGYGLEIPCIYRLYGPKPYTDSKHFGVSAVARARVAGSEKANAKM